MKRTYNSPEIKVVCVEQHNLLSGSGELPESASQQSFSVTFSDDGYDGEAASRRGGGCWDDED